MVVYNAKYLKIHDRSQYIVSQNTCCSQYIGSQNTWWSTVHSILKYMVVYNAKYLKIHGGLQSKVSQNT